MTKSLIAANWKMHGDMAWVEKLAAFNRLSPDADRRAIDILICPPFPFIAPLATTAKRLTFRSRYVKPNGNGSRPTPLT